MLEDHEHKHAVHEFDGIIENRVSSPPVYFTILFYGLIIWGVAFCAFYLLSGWSSEEEFKAKMAIYEEQHQMASEPPAGEQKPVAAAAPAETGQDGETLYQQHCASCHGSEAEGGIGPKLTGPDFIYGGSRDALHESIANGRPNGMPAFNNQLSGGEVVTLTDYLLEIAQSDSHVAAAPGDADTEFSDTPATEDESNAESSTAAAEPDAAALYAQQCAMCHGADGKGGIGPDMTDPKYIYGKSQADVVESITNGRPNGMPAFGPKLTEAEISALGEYVRAL